MFSNLKFQVGCVCSGAFPLTRVFYEGDEYLMAAANECTAAQCIFRANVQVCTNVCTAECIFKENVQMRTCTAVQCIFVANVQFGKCVQSVVHIWLHVHIFVRYVLCSANLVVCAMHCKYIAVYLFGIR